MKPIIGITACTLGSLLPKLDKGNEALQAEYRLLTENSESIQALYSFNHSAQLVFENDLRAIETAGGVPLIIPATERLEHIETLLGVVDGVLITGGYDVAPEHYDEEDQYSKGMMGDLPSLNDEDAGLFAKFSKKRDVAELTLVKSAHKKGLPIMGICRGCQVINIAMGGKIYQDIQQQGASEHDHSAIDKWNRVAHDVLIEKDSQLYQILGKDRFGINSIHHQSIKAVGQDLKVAARAEDGIIECIESDTGAFVLGVQWHPEMMQHDEGHQSILRYFVDQCKKR